MQAEDLIGKVGEAAAMSKLFGGLFLGGSFGKGQADEWSDVDLVGLALAGRHKAVEAWWRDWLEQQEHLIYFQVLQRGGVLINAITESWLRVDLHMPGDGQLGARSQDGTKPLYDPQNLHAQLVPSLPAHRPDPHRIEAMILEFIRILGLSPVGLGRREYVVMVTGTGMLRDMLSQLMQEELPLADRGGMLHLNKLLAPVDIAALEGLPYPQAEPVSLIEAQLALARLFLPRARIMSARLDIAWPQEFETNTRAHFARAIGRAADDLWPLEMNAA